VEKRRKKSKLIITSREIKDKTQLEMDVYERQIKSVDGQIDALVYELYGLSEEEIAIVEQR
jgi:hypothetical protein